MLKLYAFEYPVTARVPPGFSQFLLQIKTKLFTMSVCNVITFFRYGEVEEMNVCDNLGDHLVGNVYIKFRTEEDAAKAVAELNNRWFGGRPIYAELSPVTDFREACCRKLKFYLI